MRHCARHKTEVRIVSRGETTTSFWSHYRLNAVAALPRYKQMLERICALANEDMHDDASRVF